MTIFQSTLSSLRAAVGSPDGSSISAYKAFQALTLQMEGLVAKLQQKAALRALKFGKLHERFDSITVAEANTYAWLLPDASDASGPAPVLSEHLAAAKKTFLGWLETGSGFFYTSGKPGAGNSALNEIHLSPSAILRLLCPVGRRCHTGDWTLLLLEAGTA